MKGLFTLVIDFNGGTYITQSEADSLDGAPSSCIENWDISDIPNVLTEQDKSVILAQLKQEEFVPLTGIKNVWCGCVSLHERSLTLNLVRTENVI